MVEVINGQTGEIKEVDSIQEAAAEIERPPYWRRIGYSAADIGMGEYGIEFRKAFFEAQKEIGPIIEADSSNEFNHSKYTSLGYLLSRVVPILQKHGFSVVHLTGRVNIRNDINKLAFLPVLIEITHVETGQWRTIPLEMPIAKFDSQSIGTTFTYGRRYVTEGSLGIKSGLDDDGVRTRDDITPEALDKIVDGMFGKIIDCETEADLRKWLSENKQQFEMLGAQREEQLKIAWQSRLAELKPAKAVYKTKKEIGANG